MATFKPAIFKTESNLKNDGTVNVKIRVYHNDKATYIKTPYFIYPNEFDKSGNVSKTHPEYEILNEEIGDLVQKYRAIAIKLGHNRTKNMTCSELKEQILKTAKFDDEFIDFVEFSKKIINKTRKENTKSWYETSLKSIIWFFGKNKIDARDITTNKMNEYIQKMHEGGINNKPMDPGAINNYLRGIRSLYYKCKDYYNDEDYNIIRIPNEPFKKIKFPKQKKKRKNLQIEDIKRIRDFQGRTERERIAVDMFMIMFYLMGINVGDLFKLSGIKNGRIEYERSKVDTEDNINNFPLSIKVEPELKVLIDKYSFNRVFLSKMKERYSTANTFMDAINTGLKTICEDLDLPRATTNWSRHSWASIARNKAHISKADVDFCLGHVNNDYKMADIYIEIDYSIYDISNRKVLDLIK